MFEAAFVFALFVWPNISAIHDELDGGKKESNEKRIAFRHKGNIVKVAFSLDGNLLASSGETDGIRIWDLDKGKEVHHIQTRFPELGFSKDEKTLVYADLDGLFLAKVGSGSKPKLVAESRTIARETILVGTDVTGISVSGDGKYVVFADHTGEVRLIDVKSKKMRQLQEGNANPLSFFDCLARISPDSNVIAFTSSSGEINLWNIAEGKKLPSLRGHKKSVYSLEFSTNTDLLGSGGADGTYRIWNYQERKEIAVLCDHKDGCCGCFSPNKQELVTGDGAGVIRIWDYHRKKIVREMQGPASGIMSLAFHPQGKFFVSVGEENDIRFWNPKTGTSVENEKGKQK